MREDEIIDDFDFDIAESAEIKLTDKEWAMIAIVGFLVGYTIMQVLQLMV